MVNESEKYCFSDITYNSSTREIVISSSYKDFLTPIAGKVLCLLIENRGKLVTKDDFFYLCWNNSIVSDQSLTNVISHLRKVLRNSSDERCEIKTISKKGYILYSSNPIENICLDANAEQDHESINIKLKEKYKYSIIFLVLAVFTFYFFYNYTNGFPYYVDNKRYEFKYDYENIKVFSNFDINVTEGNKILDDFLNYYAGECMLSLFMRKYNSVDKMKYDAVNLFIIDEKGTTLNYVISKYDPEKSWDSLTEFVVKKKYFC
ncbi:TPA: transcriptional regulator [Vibrio alginolyticus]